MKSTVSLLALAALAFAAPALAASPYNETQARQKVEGAGYTKLSGLHENAAGDWTGQGDHDGRIVMFVLDTKGKVTQTAQNDAPAGTADLKVTQPPAQVTVKQAQPDVTVTQGQPTVTVHQPAPIVTVEIPQPEITVHMPKPNVAVSQAQPQVEVNQPKPQVQVMAAPQAQVSVQRSVAEINMQQAGAPQVQYTADQAKVNVKQSTGAPAVKVVQDGDDAAQNSANNGAAPAKAQANAGTATATGVAVSKLTNMNVTNLHGDVLGDVERIVKSKADGRDYVVMGHGGFLGLGQKHVALPVDKMALRDGKLEMRGLTDDEIRSMKSFNDDDAAYTRLDASQTVPVTDTL